MFMALALPRIEGAPIRDLSICPNKFKEGIYLVSSFASLNLKMQRQGFRCILSNKRLANIGEIK